VPAALPGIVTGILLAPAVWRVRARRSPAFAFTGALTSAPQGEIPAA